MFRISKNYPRRKVNEKKIKITLFFLFFILENPQKNLQIIDISMFLHFSPCKAHRFKIMLKFQKPVEEYHFKNESMTVVHIIQCSKSASFWFGSRSWIRSVDLKSRKYQLLKNFFLNKTIFLQKMICFVIYEVNIYVR